MHRRILAYLAAVLGTLSLQAQVVLTGTSYTQNFNDLGSGLPTGWSVYSSATATSLGSADTFTSTATLWNAATAGTEFRNIASNDIAWGAASGTQAADANRALGWRPLDAATRNGAITLSIAGTTGFSNFNLSFSLFVTNDVSGTQNYDVEYRVGSAGSFTKLGATFTTPDTGSTAFTVANYSFDSAALAGIAGQGDSVYLRIRGTNTSGSGGLDTIGLDNFQLTYSAIPEPASYAAGAGLAALAWAALRRRQLKPKGDRRL